MTYFNADRTINTFVVATEAMFCANFKRGVDGPPSPPLLLAPCYRSTDSDQLIMNKQTDKVSYLSHSPPASRHTICKQCVSSFISMFIVTSGSDLYTTTCCLDIVIYEKLLLFTLNVVFNQRLEMLKS